MVATAWTITGGESPTSPVPLAASNGGAVTVKWFAAYAAAWILLAGLAELPDSSGLAAGLAVSIAIGVSYKLLPETVDKMKGII